MNLAENIYRLRTDKNMSQLDLADALEVSRQSVSKWETGTAVPELDKLVKMSKLFEISLDELVNGDTSSTGETPAATEVPAPRVIYVEKPAFPTIRRRHMIGAVTLFCALLYALVLYAGRSTEETLSLVMPVAACGVVCLVSTRPLFWCGWIALWGYWAHFFVLFPRWEEHTVLQLAGIGLVVVLYCRSIYLHSCGLLRLPVWIWTTLTAIVLGLGILLMMNSPLFGRLWGY